MNAAFLCSRYLYDCKIDRHRVLLAAAIDRLPGCQITVTGYGWPGYDAERSVASNLSSTGLFPEVLWVYQQANDHLHIEADNVDAVRVMLMYDCYAAEKRAAEIAVVDPHVVCYTHANDADRLKELAPRARLSHVPFGVDREVFYRKEYGDRPIDCLAVGQAHPEFYPLRARWRRLVESGAIPGEVRRMPPYRLEPDECVSQYGDWAASMRRAKIVLTGSSKWRYPLQVFYAAAMCGCLVCADMPDDPVYRDTLGVHQLAVDPMAPDETLAAVVNHMLRSPEELRRRAETARAVALERYTSDQMAELFTQACRSALPASRPSSGA